MRVTLCFRPPFCLLPLGFLLAPFVLTTPLNFLSSFNVSFHLRREEEKGRREEEEEGGRRNEKTEGEGRRRKKGRGEGKEKRVKGVLMLDPTERIFTWYR